MESFHQEDCICPLDSRYSAKIEKVREIFGPVEQKKVQVQIEFDYFVFLCDKLTFLSEVREGEDFSDHFKDFKKKIETWNADSCKDLYVIEKKIQHDVKAVEYFVRKELQSTCSRGGGYSYSIEQLTELVHFGLTSQDINSLTTSITIKKYNYYIREKIEALSKAIGSTMDPNTPILSRTHGQPATPTTLHTSFLFFSDRLKRELTKLHAFVFLTKFGGAVGDMNAHNVGFAFKNWEIFLSDFVFDNYGVIRQDITKQTDPNDWLAEYLQIHVRINNILIGFCQDVWHYISNGLICIKKNEDHVGSSTMPHKVNPILFENAEGNLQLANANLNFVANKITITRLQRDLTDSTVIRNLGMIFGYQCLALSNIEKGISEISYNEKIASEELENHYEVLFEAIQSIMRARLIENSYDIVKKMSHGANGLSRIEFHRILDTAEGIPEDILIQFRSYKPGDYVRRRGAF